MSAPFGSSARISSPAWRQRLSADFADRCFRQIEGFGTYGFPESHAAAFAQLVYVSAWMKRHHPAAFACALLNSQPMGFYAPAQIVRDARDHDVRILAADALASDWDCSLEPDPDSEGGLALSALACCGQVQGSPRSSRQAPRRAAGPPGALTCADDLHLAAPGSTVARWNGWRRPMPSARLGLDRRAALWEAAAVERRPPPQGESSSPPPACPPRRPGRRRCWTTPAPASRCATIRWLCCGRCWMPRTWPIPAH